MFNIANAGICMVAFDNHGDSEIAGTNVALQRNIVVSFDYISWART